MKKLLSLTLALAAIGSMVLPAAAAAGQTDARLTAVTAQVKNTLDLDTSAYTSFYGDLDDNPLSPAWNLEWSGEDIWLSVSATEDGKILSYSTSSISTAPSNGQFAPAFPARDRDSAREAALAFLDRVLEENESAVLRDSGNDRLGATQYRFSGDVLVNGLDAGLSFSVSVRCEDNAIVRFYRDDLGGEIMGGIPSSLPKILSDQAAQTLRETLALRLEYVLPEDGGTHAVLRYLPESGDEYYVDASTGELVNLSELERNISKKNLLESGSGASNGAAAEDSAEAPAPSLSPAELEGIARLEGVLDRNALDAKARAVTELGLKGYTLATASYSVDRSEPDQEGQDGKSVPVTASLRYGKQVDGVTWRRTVTLDARTGELLTVSTSGRLPEGAESKVDFQKAQAAAEQFLTKYAPGQFVKTELYNSREASDSSWSVAHSFTYAQKENGYFYPGNAFYVGVDATDGSISSYSKSFDDSVTFDSPAGIISAGAAVDAWLNTYETTLQYVRVPAAIDFSKPEYEALKGWGVSYLYKLALGYRLERFEYAYGIDAKTGEAVYHASYSDDGITYDDLSGHWAQAQIEKLARYGVGYAGGSFQPGKALTQLDMVALLMSAEGYLYRPDQEGAADALYDYACSQGLITREERDDNALLTRAQAVRLLLNAAGYGPVARLEGIFRTGFTDDAGIPAEYYGYAALAQGLGIVSGAPGSYFLPNQNATRAEAAVMLYNLMNR